MVLDEKRKTLNSTTKRKSALFLEKSKSKKFPPPKKISFQNELNEIFIGEIRVYEIGKRLKKSDLQAH